jgi:hypothetical protein
VSGEPKIFKVSPRGRLKWSPSSAESGEPLRFYGSSPRRLVLVVQASSGDRLDLGCGLGGHETDVLLASDGRSALDLLRQHHASISSLVTDTALREPLSGLMLPFWFRFYNPFGPVIYLSDDPGDEFGTVQYSAVLRRACPAGELMREILLIEEEVRAAHTHDARIAGWSLSGS